MVAPAPHAPDSDGVSPPPNVRHVIAVGGGRGGVGKSVVAVNLAVYLAQLGRTVALIDADPAVDTVVGFTGGARAGGAFMFVNLKPLDQRNGEKSADVIARLRPKLGRVEGLNVFLNPVQDLRMGGRSSNSTCTSSSRPPLTTAAATPSMRSRDLLTCSSATRRRCTRSSSP